MGPVVKTLIQTAVLALSSLIASHAIADAQPSRNLAEAVKNFSEYNSRLEQAMAQGLTPESLAQIHERPTRSRTRWRRSTRRWMA